MFKFTKLNVCALLALLSIKSIQGAPINIGLVEEIIESVLDEMNLPVPSDSGAANLVQSGSASNISPSPTASGVFTIVTSIGGPALTLADNGTTTVFNGATYTINSDAAPTSVVGNLGDPSNSTDTTNSTNSAVASGSASISALVFGSGSGSASASAASATSSGSAPASSTTSTASSASSGASSVSSASSSAKSSSSSSSSTALRPFELSTPLARSLFTVTVGIILGSWCL
ncbi:hypothetical protein DFH07DRAFT_1055559 [Mycena maculata]|uniref:Uncharacterized protein n=1 Tax=Mycena maculata TaxID=230809 RepID=A0AAD7K8G9_9AGAR|nr:hypothetical protein DFH07DRAFT_1055559 [Mycena maculata]